MAEVVTEKTVQTEQSVQPSLHKMPSVCTFCTAFGFDHPVFSLTHVALEQCVIEWDNTPRKNTSNEN